MSEQNPRFEAGEVVRLKSGGPRMTVVKYDQFGYSSEKSYLCKWFDDKHKLVESTFTDAELEKDSPKTSHSALFEVG